MVRVKVSPIPSTPLPFPRRLVPPSGVYGSRSPESEGEHLTPREEEEVVPISRRRNTSSLWGI
jgi:hypothetical protein